MKLMQCALVALLLASATLAQAQWEWKDANNVRHLSDQPPPPSVPASRIVKAPRGQMPDLRKELAEPPVSAPAPAPRALPSASATGAEAVQRRKEAEQQAAVQARNKAADAAACDSARGNLRVLESGVRIATVDMNGEQAFLDDAQKAEQMRRNRDTVATHCK